MWAFPLRHLAGYAEASCNLRHGTPVGRYRQLGQRGLYYKLFVGKSQYKDTSM